MFKVLLDQSCFLYTSNRQKQGFKTEIATRLIWTKLGAKSFYKPPGASYKAQGPQKQSETLKNIPVMSSTKNKNLDCWTWISVSTPFEPVSGRIVHVDFEYEVLFSMFELQGRKLSMNENYEIQTIPLYSIIFPLKGPISPFKGPIHIALWRDYRIPLQWSTYTRAYGWTAKAGRASLPYPLRWPWPLFRPRPSPEIALPLKSNI